MKANETKFLSILEGTKQYVVPLFQRAYSWEAKQWTTLWEDLLTLCENDEPKTHFIGSLVTMPSQSVPEGIPKYLLIDGQQRLTTTLILLIVLRDLAKEQRDENLSAEINETMVVNRFKAEPDYFRLLPTQVDREQFCNLVRGANPNTEGKLVECYNFFRGKVKQSKAEISDLKQVITSRLSVVSIVLDPDDNPHLVFESLNATGQPLTQSDLIRNFYFMRIHMNEQEKVYNNYWKPMENNLGKDLTEFIRHYLMRNGNNIRQTDVYFTLKDKVEPGKALDSLRGYPI